MNLEGTLKDGGRRQTQRLPACFSPPSSNGQGTRAEFSQGNPKKGGKKRPLTPFLLQEGGDETGTAEPTKSEAQ